MVFNDYKDTLRSYIHDDDKLVTYKWLSKEFEIHVNAAKDILKQYWEKFKDDEQLIATFLIIGLLKDESLRIEVVRDSDLETAKSKFVKVHCEHVYSLQKSLPDIQQLAFSGDGDLRFSAIKCSGIVLRETQVTSEHKDKVEPTTQSTTQNGNIQKKRDESRKSDTKSLQEKVKDSQNQKSRESLSKENDEKKEKSEKVTKEKQSKKKTEGKKPSGGSQKKENKLNFFGVKSKEGAKEKVNDEKQDTRNDCDEEQKHDQKSESSKQIEDKASNITKKNESNEKKNTKDDEEQTMTNGNKTKSNSQKTKTVKSSRGTKRNRSQENNALSKRKRIVVIDSSEDESGESSKELEEEPMEVNEEPVKKQTPTCPSPPAEKRENGKRMVRKTVDKVYKDENGYLVTKREFVYEPASEEQEDLEVKKEEPKKSKPVEAKSKKQTSLMSFFKKS